MVTTLSLKQPICVCSVQLAMLESPKYSNQPYRNEKRGHSDHKLIVMSIYGIPYEFAVSLKPTGTLHNAISPSFVLVDV